MKKIILTIAASLMAMSAFAQAKGQITVGGMFGLNVNANSSKTVAGELTTKYNNSAVTFTINPEVGYFIEDNLKVGAKFGMSFGSSTYLMIAPMAGYYIPITDDLYYAPEAYAGVQMQDIGSTASSTGFLFSLGVGNFEYRVRKSVAVSVNVMNVSFSAYSHKDKDHDIKANSALTNLTIGSPSVGVKFYF